MSEPLELKQTQTKFGKIINQDYYQSQKYQIKMETNSQFNYKINLDFLQDQRLFLSRYQILTQKYFNLPLFLEISNNIDKYQINLGATEPETKSNFYGNIKFDKAKQYQFKLGYKHYFTDANLNFRFTKIQKDINYFCKLEYNKIKNLDIRALLNIKDLNNNNTKVQFQKTFDDTQGGLLQISQKNYNYEYMKFGFYKKFNQITSAIQFNVNTLKYINWRLGFQKKSQLANFKLRLSPQQIDLGILKTIDKMKIGGGLTFSTNKQNKISANYACSIQINT